MRQSEIACSTPDDQEKAPDCIRATLADATIEFQIDTEAGRVAINIADRRNDQRSALRINVRIFEAFG